MFAVDSELADWIGLIRSEYLESPGLSLTRPQVQRLWSVEPSICDAVLEALMAAGFLRQMRNGLYVRADADP